MDNSVKNPKYTKFSMANLDRRFAIHRER